MKYIRLIFVFSLVSGGLFLCGCIGPEAHPAAGTDQGAMGNPATLYCHSLGYKSEIRKYADGSEYGICILPDGTERDEWELFREAHETHVQSATTTQSGITCDRNCT